MRGSRGGFHPNSRPNQMPIAPNHQSGMMQPNMPVKRGPPMGPPGPKRGKCNHQKRTKNNIFI